MLILIKSLFDFQQWVSNPSAAKFGYALYINVTLYTFPPKLNNKLRLNFKTCLSYTACLTRGAIVKGIVFQTK